MLFRRRLETKDHSETEAEAFCPSVDQKDKTAIRYSMAIVAQWMTVTAVIAANASRCSRAKVARF